MKQQLAYVLTSILMMSFGLAQVEPTLEQLQDLRRVLSLYEDVETAKTSGYKQFMDCMAGSQGSQGTHFLNGALVDAELELLQPELLMYETRADGSLRLIAAEYVVFQQAWHEAGNEAAPTLLGREFYLNTTLLEEPFYGLHAWVWQYNPLGFFANWNPLVSCSETSATNP